MAWHEREHARLRGVLSHPPRELRDAPTPELAFEVEKTILSPAKSAASGGGRGGGGGVAAAREDLRGAVAAARAAAAKASPARQQLHWNEPPSPARAPAPIYESSPSVSSAEEDDDAPTPRTTPPTPAFGAGASRAYDNPMADDAADLDGEELAREAAAAAAEREAEAAAAVFAERVDRAFNSVQHVQHEASRGSIDDAGEDLVELDVGLMADDDDDVYVADDDSHVQRVQREAAGTPAGRVTVEPRSDTIAAFVDGSRRLPEFEGVGGRGTAAARSVPPRTSLPIEPRDVRKPGRRPGLGLGRISARGWHSCRRRGPSRPPRRPSPPLARAARVTAGRAPRAAPQTGSRQAHRGRRGGRRQGGLEGTVQAAASQPVRVLRGERRQAGGGRVAADAGVCDAAQRMNTSARGGVVFVSASTTRLNAIVFVTKSKSSPVTSLFEPWNELFRLKRSTRPVHIEAPSWRLAGRVEPSRWRQSTHHG